ncbi:hypothetical protein GGX14DRAFT_314236, partial [Mycena pura]
WDGWPDGAFEWSLDRDELKETNHLPVHWVSSKLPGGRHGSVHAITPSSGKLTRYKCLGTLQCRSSVCSVHLQIPPSQDLVDMRQQLQVSCLCGAPLHYVPCSCLFLIASICGLHPRTGHSGLGKRKRAHWPASDDVNAARPLSKAIRKSKDTASMSIRERRLRSTPKKQRLVPLRPTLHGEDESDDMVLASRHLSQHLRSPRARSQDSQKSGQLSLHNGTHYHERRELLFLSSTFEPRFLKCWVPVLMSYSNGAEHYRIHFLHLFRGLARQCDYINCAVDDELFANVVDFSDAQRNGFILAFVDFWTRCAPNERTEQQLRADGAALLKGCKQHFENQITRVSKISRVVAPDKRELFRKYAY